MPDWIFDDMNKKHYTIPVFVPHIGCPHNCVFCNQKQITGADDDVTALTVEIAVKEYLKHIDKNSSYVEIAFFGGSFTGIDFDKQTELLEKAYEFVKNGDVDSLRCSTRPDFITPEILDNLKKYGMKTIELGVQSMDDEVLKKSARGHSREDVFTASRLIKEKGFNLGLQMMPYLPGDTREKTIKTAEDIICLMPECVRIYPTLVVGDTALCRMYEKGLYTPATVEDAVMLCAELVEMFESNGIDVIRIGLQTTDGINLNTVKGPYHEALGELVRNEIYKKRIEAYIKDNDITDDFVYTVEKGEISKAAGHKKSNVKYINEKYGITVKIKEKCEG